MKASNEEIEKWFNDGVERGALRLLVVCDTFSYEQYPVYVSTPEELKAAVAEYDGKNMQWIEERYMLTSALLPQLSLNGRVRYLQIHEAAPETVPNVIDNAPNDAEKALERLKEEMTKRGLDVALFTFEQMRYFISYPTGGYYNYETRVTLPDSSQYMPLDTRLMEKNPEVAACDISYCLQHA